jgi:hypothetical protein
MHVAVSVVLQSIKKVSLVFYSGTFSSVYRTNTQLLNPKRASTQTLTQTSTQTLTQTLTHTLTHTLTLTLTLTSTQTST